MTGREPAAPASPRAAWLESAGVLLTGLAASVLVARYLPLYPADPLRGTLVAVPALMAAFHQLARRAQRAGARPLRSGASWVEAGAVVVLALVALGRGGLALPAHVTEVVAGGLALVLLHRAGRQLLALRPLLGRRLTSRPPWHFFALPWLVYLAILPWSAGHHQPDGDEPFYLLMTHSLAWDLDDDLTNDYADEHWRAFMDRPIEPQPGDPVGPGGELYSRHNALLPLVLAPIYRIAGLAGVLVAMAALAAALAYSTLRLARHYVPRRPGESLVAYGLMAFASPLILYSYQVWVEVPAALLATFALDQILTLEKYPSPARSRWGLRQWAGIGVPILLLPLVKMRFMLIAGPLLALAWWHSGRPKKPLIILAVLLVVVGGGLLLHNHLVYDNPLKIHSWEELELHHYSPLDYLRGGLGLLFDSAFGLFAATPIWLLLLPAALLVFRERRQLLTDLVILTAPYLVVVVPRSEWYGGWSPPFRYALVALPLLALMLVPLLRRRRGAGARALLAGLGAVTLGLLLLWLLVPGWTYNFADGRTYLLDHLSTRLDTDVARLFPSTVRPRLATWLVPPLALALVTLLWWRPRSRRWPAAAAGVAAAFLALALVPPAASNLPTRVVHFEDPWVSKSGGHLHPRRWAIDRTRYHGGWVLRQGEHLSAPVVAGGAAVEITIRARFVRNSAAPMPVEIRAGERVLERWQPLGDPQDDRTWYELRIGPLPWPAGEELVIASTAPRRGALNGLVLDKAELRWR